VPEGRWTACETPFVALTYLVSIFEAIVLLLELRLRLNLAGTVLLASEVRETNLNLSVCLLESSVVLAELGKLLVDLLTPCSCLCKLLPD
jgi:hypothetical protein